MKTTRMRRRSHAATGAALLAMVLAALLAITTDASCGTAGAAAKQASCGGCKPSLRGSAFGDTEPAAGDVGTTAGQGAVLKVKLNAACNLPRGARMVLIRQEIDFTGNDVGRSVRLRCGRSSCRIPQRRSTEGGYRYQVAIVGCNGAKRSKVVTIVWAPKPTVQTPPPSPSPSPPPSAAVTMRMNAVTYFNQPTDPACTAPLPSGAGQASASYNHPFGNFNHAWEWSVPAEITQGAAARTKVSTNSPNNGGTSASISIRPPSEFGIEPGIPQIDAVVPVGGPGADENFQDYTFNPRRGWVVGEKLYILIGFGCASISYEYVGV
jgi:hypothetical protein